MGGCIYLVKRIAIIGSTGSIGTQALDIISDYPDQFEVKALVVHQNIDLLQLQIENYQPDTVVVVDRNQAHKLSQRLSGKKIAIKAGMEAITELVTRADIDVVLMAIVGIAGLEPTIAALRAGKTIALANKEVMVVGGHIINNLVKQFNGRVIPVDSEHSAVFQAIQGCKNPNEIRKIILTASGGPFRGYDRDMLRNITPEDALRHPNWKMGNKITIDSATLMNKGLEVIEAKWMFNVDLKSIEVVIHPQSVVHSMVEFIDGTVIAQMGVPDMRIPILYALTHPNRFRTKLDTLDLTKIGSLTFEEPDLDTFPCLSLAYEALKIGGTMPTALNAANEVAVNLFLEGRLAFSQIPIIIERAMASHRIIKDPQIDDVLNADKEIRRGINYRYC
ncbi:MAG TPA: 1-deoxy-D-xylulose-5-phosphate reductoisomerase [Clostridiales bacterium]|nr:1-deoxy-D-xylulose-5-phosphate reductoisomerase [Clostridiales bacterium]